MMPLKKSKTKTPPPSPTPDGVDKEMVVKLAYELYVSRGGEHGRDVEDWLAAEQMVRERQKRAGRTRRAADASRRVEDKFSR